MTKTLEAKTIREINGSFEIKSALFQDVHSNERQYLWGEGETSDVVGPARVSDLIDDWGLDGGVWVIFYLADCAFPPLYAIRGRTFEEAYEVFVDWHAENQHGLKIEDSEMADYDQDNLNYTSNGIPVDTESVGGFEVKLVSVTMA